MSHSTNSTTFLVLIVASHNPQLNCLRTAIFLTFYVPDVQVCTDLPMVHYPNTGPILARFYAP